VLGERQDNSHSLYAAENEDWYSKYTKNLLILSLLSAKYLTCQFYQMVLVIGEEKG